MGRSDRILAAVLGVTLGASCAPARPIATEGGSARIARPRCPLRFARIPKRLQEDLRRPLTVRFLVDADGHVDQLTMLSPNVPDEITSSVEEAVKSCAWQPARDAAGNRVAAWVVLPLKFQATDGEAAVPPG